MWNLVPATWIEAINAGFFAISLSITLEIVHKYYSKTIELAKEHMKADRKNTRSTKNNMHREMTTKPQQDNINKQVRQNEYYVKTIDLTGKYIAIRQVDSLSHQVKAVNTS